MKYNDLPLNVERFGTSPVSDAYFKFVTSKEYDEQVKEMMESSAHAFEKGVPFDEFEGIGIDMSGPEPIFSKGWRDFFNKMRNDLD